MFGIDPRKAGFWANADPGNVCGARNAQFEQGEAVFLTALKCRIAARILNLEPSQPQLS